MWNCDCIGGAIDLGDAIALCGGSRGFSGLRGRGSAVSAVLGARRRFSHMNRPAGTLERAAPLSPVVTFTARAWSSDIK